MIKDRRRVTTWKLTEHLVKCDKVPGVEGQIVVVDHVRVFSSIIIFHSHDGRQDQGLPSCSVHTSVIDDVERKRRPPVG